VYQQAYDGDRMIWIYKAIATLILWITGVLLLFEKIDVHWAAGILIWSSAVSAINLWMEDKPK
jgi:hypothetical protein